VTLVRCIADDAYLLQGIGRSHAGQFKLPLPLGNPAIYTARGAVALERLAEDAQEEIVYTFTKPWILWANP